MGNREFFLENAGGAVLLNGALYEARDYERGVQDGTLWQGEIVYEVVRVIGGVPVFFRDHHERLLSSLARVEGRPAMYGLRPCGAPPPGVPPPAPLDAPALRGAIGALLAANGARDCNVKIWVAARAPGTPAEGQPGGAPGPPSGGQPGATAEGQPGGAMRRDWFMNVNRGFYPPERAYQEGVAVGILDYTRHEPNVKRVVEGYKERVQALSEHGGYAELLLCDADGFLTEGSRTNLFYVQGGRLGTAPDGMILKGVARKHVLAAARRLGIETALRPLARGALRGADALFLTGTSIHVLPVAAVEGARFGSTRDPIVLAVRREFARIVQEGLAGAAP
jgi:branched-subunit amino acid aminotransferase/4-amino-4-deoxychorismate lyase